MYQLMSGIEGLLVAFRPIFERGVDVVCIAERSVIMGPTEEKAVFLCAPSLWHFAEASGTSALCA